MKARDLIGRRIVAVEQERRQTNVGDRIHLIELVLDNGTRVGFVIYETEDLGYVIEATTYKVKGKTNG